MAAELCAGAHAMDPSRGGGAYREMPLQSLSPVSVAQLTCGTSGGAWRSSMQSRSRGAAAPSSLSASPRKLLASPSELLASPSSLAAALAERPACERLNRGANRHRGVSRRGFSNPTLGLGSSRRVARCSGRRSEGLRLLLEGGGSGSWQLQVAAATCSVPSGRWQGSGNKR
jgi:hypothetical protein